MPTYLVPDTKQPDILSDPGLNPITNQMQYDKLFSKMYSMGFSNETLNWFKDYLTGRQPCVDIEGETSDRVDAKLGVPQGSILGPILFLIYVNDINKCNIHAAYAKFADDTTISTHDWLHA